MIERESLESDVATARIVSSDVGRFLVNWRMTTVREMLGRREKFHDDDSMDI